MPATQLGIYNDALRAIGERKLASLLENTEPRRLLDDHWNRSGVTMGAAIFCLELGLWGFARRSSALTYNSAVQPPFGFAFAFDKPTDWVRTAAVCSDPYFKQTLADTGYADEAAYWFADLKAIYVKYISKDASYGLNLSIWPMSFCELLALYLAKSTCLRLTGSQSLTERVDKQWLDAEKKAKGIDGTNQPTAVAPMGTWAGARMAGRRLPENR